jgi:alpha-tubulin suppressor-like RCC1 family protein
VKKTHSRHRSIRGFYRSLAVLSALAFLAVFAPAASAAPTASAWGDSTYGELGNGTSGNGSATKVPVLVSGLGDDVKAISAGGPHALALLQDGTVMAWGNNGAGGLGDGTIVQRDAPVSVNGLSGVKAIAAGEGHSLALMNDGTVMAWGRNDVGQLGLGTTTGPETCMSQLPCSTAPVQVKGLSGVKAIATSYDHSLALLNDGTVVAWGRNQWGELGTGSTGPNVCGDGWLCNPTPTPIAGLGGVAEVATGHSQSLALLGDGTVQAWGYNEDGNLGVGVAEGPQSCGEGWSAVSCASTPMAVQGLSGAASIASGWLHNLAVLDDGTVMAWGYNSNGQLGDGTNIDSDHPVAVSGLSGVTAVAAGSYHSVALLDDGTLESWGWNILWSLGNIAAEDESRVPVPVDGLADVTSVTTGSMTGYALGGTPATFPKVSNISPRLGPEAGGTTVTIRGTGLGDVTAVKFGSADAASFSVDSDTSITAVSPPGIGTVAVTVEDPRGPSYASGSTYFRYGSEEGECMIEPWECGPEEPGCAIPEGCGPEEPECMIEPWECGSEGPECMIEPWECQGPEGGEPLVTASGSSPSAGSGASDPSSGGGASTLGAVAGGTSQTNALRRGASANRACKRKWARHAKAAQKKRHRARACRPSK